MDCIADIDAPAHSSLHISTEYHDDSDSHSITSSSSDSSSTYSVFSLDAPSSQSSISSTASSWEGESDSAYLSDPPTTQQPASYAAAYGITITSHQPKPKIVHLQHSNPVASECRQHPRRTQPQASANGCAASIGPRPPPALVRQSERKENFVESLVGSQFLGSRVEQDIRSETLRDQHERDGLSDCRQLETPLARTGLSALGGYSAEVLTVGIIAFLTEVLTLCIERMEGSHSATLEPTPRVTPNVENVPPTLRRLGPLPTPTLTPQSNTFGNTFSTPAVGAEGLCPRRSSMSIAMEQARKECNARMTLDNPVPLWRPVPPRHYLASAQRSSLAQSSSSVSSPESMISDVSSRSSRSSSISSIASSTCALPSSKTGGLAAQATRRCANMQICGTKASLLPTQPAILQPASGEVTSWETLVAGKDISSSPSNLIGYEAEHVFNPVMQNEVTPVSLMDCSASAHEAATALRDLALNHQQQVPHAIPRPPKSRKRERPLSMDLSVQASVRELVAPRTLAEITNSSRRNEDDSIVVPDGKVADSFLVPKTGQNQVSGYRGCTQKTQAPQDGPRKRTRANVGKLEPAVIDRLMTEHTLQPKPGMWEGII
ncbi:MAG: hypothetical protein Q9220_000091 [cf. Caloplaca sp. 1 TL-2023]